MKFPKLRLDERLTFSQLYQLSDPRRITRSLTVKGPPLKIESFSDSVFHVFNFKSSPSTTGHRHHGYIRFFKSTRPKPLDQLECLVDCSCPDFAYRFSWANKQRGSSVVGPKSMNRAINRAPRHTNPTSRPGLCKHLLALSDYIRGLASTEAFSSGSSDNSQMMNTLMRYADNRWTTSGTGDQDAREGETELQARQLARNRGQLPSGSPPSVSSPPLPTPDQDTEGPGSNTNPLNQSNDEVDERPGFQRQEDSQKRSVVNNVMTEDLRRALILITEVHDDAVEDEPKAPPLKPDAGAEGEPEGRGETELDVLREIRDFLADVVRRPSDLDDVKKSGRDDSDDETEEPFSPSEEDANNYSD